MWLQVMECPLIFLPFWRIFYIIYDYLCNDLELKSYLQDSPLCSVYKSEWSSNVAPIKWMLRTRVPTVECYGPDFYFLCLNKYCIFTKPSQIMCMINVHILACQHSCLKCSVLIKHSETMSDWYPQFGMSIYQMWLQVKECSWFKCFYLGIFKY